MERKAGKGSNFPIAMPTPAANSVRGPSAKVAIPKKQ
jgi:hypothetical protein